MASSKKHKAVGKQVLKDLSKNIANFTHAIRKNDPFQLRLLLTYGYELDDVSFLEMCESAWPFEVNSSSATKSVLFDFDLVKRAIDSREEKLFLHLLSRSSDDVVPLFLLPCRANEIEWTPLMYSILHGCFTIARSLVQAGADVNKMTVSESGESLGRPLDCILQAIRNTAPTLQDDQPALLYSASHGWFVQAGTDVSEMTVSDRGESLERQIHSIMNPVPTLQDDQLDILKFLLYRGADPELMKHASSKITTLHENNHQHTAKNLLLKTVFERTILGHNKKLEEHLNTYAIHVDAWMYGNLYISALKTLAKEPLETPNWHVLVANIRSLFKHGLLKRMIDDEFDRQSSTFRRMISVHRSLGMDIDLEWPLTSLEGEEMNFTPLMYAVYCQKEHAVYTLLNAGSDVNASEFNSGRSSEHKRTPLDCALATIHQKKPAFYHSFVDLLLHNGADASIIVTDLADFDSTDDEVKNRDLILSAIIKSLCSKESSFLRASDFLNKYVHTSEDDRNIVTELVKEIIQNEEDLMNALLVVMKKNEDDFLSSLVLSSTNVFVSPRNLWKVLKWAAAKGLVRSVELLLEKNAAAD